MDRDNKPRRLYNKRQGNNRRGKKKERKMSQHSRRCPHCGKEMKCRGASDTNGGRSWKCRNKKCGRTEWERLMKAPPIPLAPTSFMDRK